MTHEDEVRSLESDLDRVEEAVERKDFRDAGRMFEERLRSSRSITHEQRDNVWGRYQELWTRRKAFLADRDARSRAAKERYLSTLLGLDYKYDGLPIFQNFDNFARVGEKIRACRTQIKEMQSVIKMDDALLPQDRNEIRERIDSVWHGIQSSEETTFMVHGERADALINDASRAMDALPTREAAAILRAASAEFRSLWLEKPKRERLSALFDDLWTKLEARREEGRRKHADWRVRQETGLDRLRTVRDRAREALESVRGNITANETRLSSARSAEYSARVSGWIEEGEQKARDIERSIEELCEKIRSAEDRLNDDK